MLSSTNTAYSPSPQQPASRQTPKKDRRRSGSTFAWLLVTIARGLAFFVASYSLLSLLAYVLGNTYNQNVWWIDLSFMPSPLALLLQVCLIFSLYAFVVRIPRRFKTRIFGAIPPTLFAFFSLQNMVSVYMTDLLGYIDLGFPVPFSLFILIVFIVLAIGILFGAALVPASRRSSRVTTAVTVIVSVVVIGVLFPVGQLLCFGTTEYNNKVDAVVVFGAQVMPNGVPSPVLQDRLDKAIELFEEGRTSFLVMSGGIDIGGMNEAQAMRDYAIRKGVPAQFILIDEYGMNTQDSAANTVKIIEEAGFKSVGAVSNFYHLARIKMEYLANGLDVITIPAGNLKAGLPAPFTFLREIPGWWYYWFANLVNI